MKKRVVFSFILIALILIIVSMLLSSANWKSLPLEFSDRQISVKEIPEKYATGTMQFC